MCENYKKYVHTIIRGWSLLGYFLRYTHGYTTDIQKTFLTFFEFFFHAKNVDKKAKNALEKSTRKKYKLHSPQNKMVARVGRGFSPSERISNLPQLLSAA